MHALVSLLPVFYAATVTGIFALSIGCPTAAGGTYGYPNCVCPTAQFIWLQKVKVGLLCGYPEFGTASTPPVYYSTATYSGFVEEIYTHAPQHFSGTNGASATVIPSSSVTAYGLTIAAHAAFDITFNETDTYTNTYSGTSSFPYLIDLAGACSDTYSFVDAWTSSRLDDVNDSVSGHDNTGTTPIGAGSGVTSAGDITAFTSSFPFNENSSHAPTISKTIVSTTEAQITYSGGSPATGDTDVYSGTITCVLSDPVDEATALASAASTDAQFMGSVMGATTGISFGGFGSLPTSFPGGAQDWNGPLWADRIDRQVCWADARFALLVTSLMPGLPMKVTVRPYRLSFSIAAGMSPTYGSPSALTDLVYTFTPTDTWALIGCSALSGFNPASPSASLVSAPTEALYGTGGSPSSDPQQGWLYGAEIIAVEPA
jgi:hypothetical protein